MTTAAPKLAGFAGTLVLLFGGGAVAGGLLDPSPPSGAGAEVESMAAMGAEHDAPPVRGLGVAENGLRLVVDRPRLARGTTGPLGFRIVDRRGATVRDFDVEHTKRMHLIVVRRDMSGFQHLHPVQNRDGSWTTDIRLDAAGSYRLFADFSHDGRATTLASDVAVDGSLKEHPLPRPQPRADAGDGYAVELDHAKPRAGQEAALRFVVTRDGRQVHVQRYLGASGHLVALREGDLAFLHVHPAQGITFESTFPTTGRYRLFLQFKVGGHVHTAAFTQEVI